jgi:hypothetical protein
MILHFAYVGAALIALALLAAWMFVVSRRHLIVRLGGAILAVVLSLSIWINVNSILGYAVAEMPRGNLQQIVGMMIDAGKGKIWLWIKTSDGPRAYVVPFDDQLAADLVAARNRMQNGDGMMFMNLNEPDAQQHEHINITVVPSLPKKE